MSELDFDTAILAATLLGAFGALLFSFIAMRRISNIDVSATHGPLITKLSVFEDGQQKLERSIREELRGAREEQAGSAKGLREEVGISVKTLTETLVGQANETSRQQKEQLEAFTQSLRQSATETAERLRQNHEAVLASVKEIREQVAKHLEQTKIDAASQSKALSESITASLDRFASSSRDQTRQLFEIQKNQHEDFVKRITALNETNAKAGETLRLSVENQLGTLRKENGEKLEQMRLTVDEKLQGTLEKRLGESFKIVSERLEAVHQGLGEMQSLATGVGDLKRVLTNVKSRGSWGEVQLGALLEQILTPNQYLSNASMSEAGRERVEYAIRLPGGETGEEVLLPIDAKFPIEDYERLQAAAEIGDLEALEAASKALEIRIKGSAKDISSKYINPPKTTDFAIMFLPTEGLYAEVIRRPGLCDELQRVHRVVVSGPTTLTAILNSLQMGFRTLAIQERSSEVWKVLAGVKDEFGKFGPVLEKVKKKLQEASNHIDSVERRGRAINRKLRDVEMIPANDGPSLIESVEDDLGFDDELEAGEAR